jgi:hypothetical protein
MAVRPFVEISERVPVGRPSVNTWRREMKYLMLGAITEAGQQLRGPDLELWMTEIGAWYEKYGSSGKLVDAGHQLDTPDKAKTIRASGVTDGPYMEAKEVLGGYSLLETASLDEAVEIAKTWPGIDRGWIAMEIRPVMEQ